MDNIIFLCISQSALFISKEQKVNNSQLDNNKITNTYKHFLMPNQMRIQSVPPQSDLPNIQKKQKSINIYLRRSNKTGIKIRASDINTTLLDLFQKAQKQFKISRYEMLLCISGSQYIYQSMWDNQQHQYKNKRLELQNNTIVHVHHLILPKQLTINLECLWIGRQADSIQYTISSNTKVIQVMNLYRKQAILVNKQDIIQYKLLESGRILSLNKTFEQLYIENRATIYILPIKVQKIQLQQGGQFQKLGIEYQGDGKTDNIAQFAKVQNFDAKQANLEEEQAQEQINANTQQQVEKDLQKIFGDDENQSIIQKIKNRPRSYQRPYTCLGNNSDNYFQQQTQQPNFKKKKALCLKSVHTNPEDSDYYIWRLDSSDRYSNNQNKLAKFIKCKRKRNKKQQKSLFNKQKHMNNQQQQEKSQKKLSMSARHRLKQEFQRLFQSDNLGMKIHNNSNFGQSKHKEAEHMLNTKNEPEVNIEEVEEIVFESQVSTRN